MASGQTALRLPHGNVVLYTTGRPSLRSLFRDITALGYEVSAFPLSPPPDLRHLPPGVWHSTVVVGDFILFIVTPTAPSSSSSDQSGYGSSYNEPASDSSTFDPDDYPPEGASDQNSSGCSGDGFDSDNVDPECPELGSSHP